MSLHSIGNVQIESVILDTVQKKESPIKSSMSVFTAVNMGGRSDAGSPSSFDNLRVRVVVSYGRDSCQMMDYLTQRMQEYKALTRKNPRLGLKIPPSRYISFLKGDLNNKTIGDDKCSPFFDFLKESSPLSPYSSKGTAIRTMFKNQYSYGGNGKKLPPAMAMYDAPLLNLMDNKVIKLLKEGKYSGPDAPPIQLDPIQFKFKEKEFKNPSQLSVYAYIYVLPEKETSAFQIALTTGMTSPSSVSLIGEKTIWKSITAAVPLLGIGGRKGDTNAWAQTTTESSPDKKKLIIFNLDNNLNNFLVSVADLEKNLYQNTIAPVLQKREGIKKITKKSNYFSDLWLTKDSDENYRFSFAFDLESYLAQNSHLAYLYRRRETARQILDGSGLMDRSTPSYVMNMSAKRIFIDPPSMLPINELGTSGYSTELGPNSAFPEKKIRNVTKISDIVLPDLEGVPYLGPHWKNKISFYEGKDILNEVEAPNTRHDGAFRYGIDFTVYDGAIIFMRRALQHLLRHRNALEDVYSALTSAAAVSRHTFFIRRNKYDLRNLFDANTGYLRWNAREVYVHSKHSAAPKSVAEYINDGLREYKQVLGYFLDKSHLSPLGYFANRLLDPPRLQVIYIQELIQFMDIFIQMLYRKVSEFFPTNPLGTDIPSLEKNDFEGRGFGEHRIPMMRDGHYFDRKVVVGKDYGFGLDYILETEEDNGKHNGLSRVPSDYYKVRAGTEVAKYFLPTGDNAQMAGTPTNLYDSVGVQLGEATQRFFTPLTIRVPNRQLINQPSKARGSVYPLSLYAQLFVDIFRHKSLIHPGGLHDPLILDDDNTLQQNNRLYNSVLKLLEEEHSVKITQEKPLQYPSLRVITKAKLESTALDDLPPVYASVKAGNTSAKAGPLAIPSIIGGDLQSGATIKTYLESVDSSLVSIYSINKEGYRESQLEKKKDAVRPIKLPFAIFGELSVDPQIELAITYQEKMFNSLKDLSNKLGLGANNIADAFGRLNANTIPAAIKSMLVIAATKESTALSSPPFDAVRPTLEDQDSNSPDQNISALIFGDGTELQVTGDPMKIYAKFMAFWMNYKQIAVVEYLAGFGSLYDMGSEELRADGSRYNKLQMPQWRPVDQHLINTVGTTQNKILCRVRNYTLAEYINNLIPDAETKMGHTLVNSPQPDQDLDYSKEIFDFPIYNRYFFLGEDPDASVPSPEEILPTSEDECHTHTYHVDPKGNGWTSEASPPAARGVSHKHQILNFEVQTSQSDCYPNCEVKHGVKGAAPHIHKLLGKEKQPSSPTQTGSAAGVVAAVTAATAAGEATGATEATAASAPGPTALNTVTGGY